MISIFSEGLPDAGFDLKLMSLIQTTDGVSLDGTRYSRTELSEMLKIERCLGGREVKGED